MPTDTSLVECTDAGHGSAILAILNEAIVHSTALYDYEPRSERQLSDWFEVKRRSGFPVLGMVDSNDQLQGFATYGSFRAWAAYKYTVEHSVYVHVNHRGQGIGSRLLSGLVEKATEQGLHAMVGVVDAQNDASLALHRKHGFETTGTLRQVGYKFGRWLDVVFCQKLLPTPGTPNED